jgi:phage recombination protein Bet
MTTPLTKWPDDRKALIKRTVAVGATDDELQLFAEVCQRTGLDPFSRQIYFVKRKTWDSETRSYIEKATISSGIDGFRAIAARSKQHAGTDDAIFDTETEPHPSKATVTVYRLIKGERHPFTATARWSEYAQYKKDKTLMPNWERMPYLMLSKVAEALALRKAFPADLSGVYTEDEIMVEPPKPTKVIEAKVETVDPRKKKIVLLMKQSGKAPAEETPEAWATAVKEVTGIELHEDSYDLIIEALEHETTNNNP